MNKLKLLVVSFFLLTSCSYIFSNTSTNSNELEILTIYNCDDLNKLVQGQMSTKIFIKKYLDKIIQVEGTVSINSHLSATKKEKEHQWMRVYTGKSENDKSGMIFDMNRNGSTRDYTPIGSYECIIGKVDEPENKNYNYISLEWISVSKLK